MQRPSISTCWSYFVQNDMLLLIYQNVVLRCDCIQQDLLLIKLSKLEIIVNAETMVRAVI